ncbi:unnamed protein product [Caenorhabditis auriculariae]|uniref:NR LBD domain-containing protein n=1 Tax=Caenorhabditis auriculariae TaxID=2777116 RepID=A0A8S1HJG3_9PELO|nr:unnamed protein product [Caenorhabditis auriculariae]
MKVLVLLATLVVLISTQEETTTISWKPDVLASLKMPEFFILSRRRLPSSLNSEEPPEEATSTTTESPEVDGENGVEDIARIEQIFKKEFLNQNWPDIKRDVFYIYKSIATLLNAAEILFTNEKCEIKSQQLFNATGNRMEPVVHFFSYYTK